MASANLDRGVYLRSIALIRQSRVVIMENVWKMLRVAQRMTNVEILPFRAANQTGYVARRSALRIAIVPILRADYAEAGRVLQNVAKMPIVQRAKISPNVHLVIVCPSVRRTRIVKILTCHAVKMRPVRKSVRKIPIVQAQIARFV